MNTWLLLIYSVPRQPSAARVYVWRKLRHLGAEMVQDAVWVLPAHPRSAEHFRWLTAEIREMGGQATVWQGELSDRREQDALIGRFEVPVAKEYRRILTELSSGRARRSALAKRFTRAMARDFFGCPLGQQVRAALLRGPTGDAT